MKQYVIGVDIGTGSAKAVAVNNEGKPVAASQVYYKTNSPQPGYSEQDPEIIWNAFVECIKDTATKMDQVPSAVSISSAMHSLLVVNKENIAITPLITWEDTRSEKIAGDLRASPEAESIYRATGTPIHSMTPLCKIKWMKENEKEIFEKAFKFISIKEFIWFRLFNKYEIDYSIASATALFNIENLKWNKPSLEFCGINQSQLSEPVTTDFIRAEIKGEIAATLHIPQNTRFCIGASDGCLANLGSDAVGQGTAALTIGTSGAVRIACSRPILNYSAMIFNYVLDDSTFISGGPVNNGGNVLKWMFQTFLNNSSPTDNDYENIFEQIEKIPPGSEGLIFLPYLYGERAPIWDERACGVFFGIRSLHTSAHFFRAALEGICFALNNILEIIESSASILQQINVSGGFVHSKIWMQILADITGKDLCLVQTEDASSVGAALLGLKAIEIISDYTSLNDKSNDKIIEPVKISVDIYKKHYSIFKNLYEPLKEAMHKLYEMKN
ncbi:MAG TPA: gluconokinase [Ginsengibacter sp.]